MGQVGVAPDRTEKPMGTKCLDMGVFKGWGTSSLHTIKWKILQVDHPFTTLSIAELPGL